MLGVHDYVNKNGFPGVLVGVSGGIDSAVVLALACDALGPDRVTAVMMPSPYNSPETRADGRELVDRLGCRSYEFSIESVMQSFDEVLLETFAGHEPDQTEENVQARIRGTLLMALSNKFGALVLTTGNKSEMAVGYATLYGDMAGGFAVLKDVPKQLVFALARWRNDQLPLAGCAERPIPQGIIDRPPSAELRPDQTDEKTLGSYEALDDVITRYIELDQGLDEIVASGVDRDFAARILRMIDLAEYKRRQAPPGVKITHRAFGRDRRMPITAVRRFE
jgi:NAD+ synthase (glutamine-hydrolysing)